MENKNHYKDSYIYPRDSYNPNSQIINENFYTNLNPNYIYKDTKKHDYDRYYTVNSTYGNFFDKGEDKNPQSKYMENFLKSMGHSNKIYSFVEKEIKEETEEKSGKKNNNVLSNNPATFWMGNLNNSNMYRSFTKGPNPFAKSHAFTQPIQKTRGAYQYYQNAYNDI